MVAPYLNGIRAFEAAARLGSIAAASGELGVTPAAVSRLVKLLEARMGVALFTRHANRLALTEAGAHYRDGLAPLLHGIACLTEQVAARAAPRAITVGVGASFAMRWLIPRLARFQAVAPDVEVRIVTGGATRPHRSDWTCGIRLGDGVAPGLVATRLFGADILPVATPAVAARLRGPADLAGVPLLRVAHAPGDWPRWLAAAGCTGITPHGPVFDVHGQALQAATDGLGVALGFPPYLVDDLAAGRLVAPFPLAVPRGDGWYLLHEAAREAEPGFRAFRDWLLAESLPPPATGITPRA
jgi:LysR family glycine cleavage system transcriptional activator